MSKKTYEVLSNLTSYQANAIQNLTVALIKKKKGNYSSLLLVKVHMTNESLCTNLSRAQFAENIKKSYFLKKIYVLVQQLVIRTYPKAIIMNVTQR